MPSHFELPPARPPKLIKAVFLAPDEGVIRETRATAWFYFPGPVTLLLLSAFFLYASAAAVSSAPGIPYLTDFFASYSVSVPFFGSIWVLLFGILAAAALFWMLVRVILWGRNVYAITPRRVVLQRGIVSREFDQIPIVQIRGVRVRISVAQRLLRYGTVIITAEGETPSGAGQEEWDGIPHAFEWPRLIDAVTQARNQMSIDQAASAAVTAAEEAERQAKGQLPPPPPPGYVPPPPPPRR